MRMERERKTRPGENPHGKYKKEHAGKGKELRNLASIKRKKRDRIILVNGADKYSRVRR
jgi:hypothetical protein